MIAALSPALPLALPAATPRTSAAPSALPATSPPAPPAISPNLRIDGALNLVVLEFRAPDGEVLHSLPTPREIAAYRDESAAEARGVSVDRTG